MEFRPLQNSDLPDAARLLARRHRTHRTFFPELPADAESDETAEALLSASLGRESCVGWGAFAGDRLQAYLIGETVLDPWWGRSGWIRAGGSAWATTARLTGIPDLYAPPGRAAGFFRDLCALCRRARPVNLGPCGLVVRAGLRH